MGGWLGEDVEGWGQPPYMCTCTCACMFSEQPHELSIMRRQAKNKAFLVFL